MIQNESYRHFGTFIIISSSSSAHHHFIITIIIIIIISSFHHHLIIIIIIIISPSSSSSSFPSLSLAFLFFSILAQASSHEKRARCNPSQGKCVFRAKKCQKLRVFGDFIFFGATLCGNPAVECQKLKVFCEFFWPGAPLLGKTRVECQKLMVFCDFGVPEFVLRIVLTIRFASYGRFEIVNFFSCDCLVASMARSVNCLGHVFNILLYRSI